MADKVGLIPHATTSLEKDKNNKTKSSITVNEEALSSLKIDGNKMNESTTLTDSDLKKGLKSQKNKSKDTEESSSYSSPNLYQKLVTSFDAVLQNLVSEGYY